MKKCKKLALVLAVGVIVLFMGCVFYKCYAIYSVENAFTMWEPAVDAEHTPGVRVYIREITPDRIYKMYEFELDIFNGGGSFVSYSRVDHIDYQRGGEWFTVYQKELSGPLVDYLISISPGEMIDDRIHVPFEALPLDGRYRIFLHYDVGYGEFDFTVPDT